MRSKLLIMAVLVLFCCAPVMAQDGTEQPTDQAQGGGDLRSAVQNPISSLISLPFKFTFDYGADNGEASFLNIQPVIPVTIGDWNLVNRVIVPLIDTDGEITGTPDIPNPPPGDGASGLGDINYSLFLSPVKYETAIWGIGPSLTAPTASDDELGSEKWSAAQPPSFFSSPNGEHTACSADSCGRLPGTPIATMSTKRCSSPF